MKIAVDFDGTLCIKGKPNTGLIMWLKSQQAQGNEIVLYTSRTGKRVNEAVGFCARQGLMLNGVIGGKPVFDVYIDDKAVNPFR